MRVLLRSTSMIGMAMLLLSLAISAYAGPFEEGQTAAAAGDYAKAFELWRPLAKKGNVAAQDSLGVMYYYGRGVKKDYEESMDWFRKAAKQGDAMAQRELGIMYNRGRGDDQDLEDGAKWIRLAAEQGDAKAECMMGELLQNGLGVPVNPAEAEKWYLAAAQQNHVRAQIHVGSILLDRSPCRKRAPAGWRGAKPRSTLNCPCPDDTTAVKWYRLAASQNDPLGVRYLAIIDSLAFESVRNTHAASAYEQYLLLYPSGQYATAAADSLAALDFAAAKKANTLDAFYQFLARHPEGPDAEEAMGTVAMRLGSLRAYEEFLQRFPNSRRAPEMQMRRSAAPILSDGPGSRFTIRALTPIGTATGIVGLGGGGTIWGDGYAMTFTVPILGSSMSRRGFELAFGHGAIYSFTGRCSLSDIFVLGIARVMGADREKDAEISALMKGYVFDSTDASDPLTFVVVRDHGFVYVSGKGTVTLPNGKQMRF